MGWLMGVTSRNYHEDDNEAIAELRKAMAIADATDDGLIIVEPPPTGAFFGRPSCDDLILVHDDAGCILATVQPQAEIGPQQGFIWCFPAVHPEARGTNIERLLLERLWQWTAERRPEIPSKSVYLHVHCGAHQRERIALYESLGLRWKCDSPHMVYYPLEDLRRPLAPPSIELRPYSPGTDDESAVDTLNQAFADDPRYVPMSREQWLRWLNAPEWRRDLSLVAADGDQVVGLCLCLINDERIRWMGRRDGYVDTMCVRPSHQRRGVGSALLLAGLQALRKAGMVSATLETDDDNPTEAGRFYERVGFRKIWRWSAYGTELR
jgi:ribosomal protein S18 acetylase RimI-like enzyme